MLIAYYHFLFLLVLLAVPACWWLKRGAEVELERRKKLHRQHIISEATKTLGMNYLAVQALFATLEKKPPLTSKQLRGLSKRPR